jgi:hypothetical protein
MFKIDLQNIQAIGNAHIVVENNTIVEFVGDNSNGKSVISKVIENLVSGDIAHEDVRRTLIKDNTEQGVVIFTYNEKQLGLILKPAVKESLIMYKPNIIDDPENAIFRAINDADGLNAIVREFGFRAYANGDICLQLHPTWGAIPFITTSGATNNSIVEDITRDKIADNFLSSFQTITFPVFKEKIARLQKEHDSAKAVLDNMESYDWRAYDAIYEELSEVYQQIKDYEYCYIDDIPVPDLSVVPVSNIQIPDIPIIQFYDLCSRIPYPKSLDDYLKVLSGVCPTCGRPLFEHKS